MKLTILCVLEDGSLPRSSALPANPRKALRIQVGGDVTLETRVVRANGQVVTGGTLRWTAKKSPTDTQVAFFKDAVCADPTLLTLSPVDTKDLRPGLYAYDVWHIDAQGKQNSVLPTSPLYIEPTVHTPQVIAAPTDTSLLAWWSMEDGNNFSIVRDSVSGVHNLTTYLHPSPPPLVAGRVGVFARDFTPRIAPPEEDGAMIHAALAPVPEATRLLFSQSSYSVALWMKTLPIAGFTENFQCLLSVMSSDNGHPDLFSLFYRSDVPQVLVGAGGFTTTLPMPNINVNKWTHIAATYDRLSDSDGTFRIYTGGVLTVEESNWWPPADLQNAFWNMGGLPVMNDQFSGAPFYGHLDEVRFYNRKLSDAEVLALASV